MTGTHIITALDGDTVSLFGPHEHTREGTVTILDATSCPLGRDAVVALMNGLNESLLTFDAAEKAKAEAKLKAGDKVVGNTRTETLYVVTRDEDADGMTDLVLLRSGQLLRNRAARHFKRVPDGAWVPGPAPQFSAHVRGGPF